MTDDLDQTTITPSGSYEPAADAAPATPVRLPDAPPGGGRYRWAIAIGVVALVIAVSALALTLFTGRAANAVVLGYVPEDSIMYGEARLDLPGDQRANLGAFLSRFPGFADQSTLDTKIDDVLDRLIGEATAGGQTFSSDIKPWFGGQFAFSVGALPDPDVVATDPAAMADARFLVLVSIKDEAAAKSWLDATIAESGATTSTESYGGATLNLFTGQGETQAAYVLLGGKVAVAGDVGSVRAAVDTNGMSGFAAKAEPAAALQATTGDHVGFVYIALRPLIDWTSQLSASGIAGTVPSGAVLGLIPDWAAFALRVEGDALLLEAVAPKPAEQSAETTNRTSTVADHVPASAVALSISHDYGRGLVRTLEGYRSDASLEEVIDALDQAIGFLGGADAALGWIGDVGITVTRTDASVDGGLIIAPTDAAAAGQLFSSLRTVLALGGSTMGISVRDESYAGSTITIVDLGNLGDLAGQAGIPTEMLGTDALPEGRIELAFAITDQVVVLGSGPGFVRSVLDTTPATSIAASERYKALVARVGQGPGIGYVDITAIRELIEGGMASASPEDRADYETRVKPFLVPFDALVASTSLDGELNRSTMLVTVK